MNSRATGISTGAQSSAAMTNATASRPSAPQRSFHGRHAASTITSVTSARKAAKIISASAASAKKRPAIAAYRSFGCRSVFTR